MGLWDQASADNRAILESLGGFGRPFTLTDPSGFAADLVGMPSDIGFSMDPSTQIGVAMRRASICFRLDTVRAAGFAEQPRGVANHNQKPWLVSFQLPGELDGPRTYKIVETAPDRLGCIICFLEEYAFVNTVPGFLVLNASGYLQEDFSQFLILT